MTTFVKQIKGSDWNINLMTQRQYNRKHKEHKNTSAMTNGDKNIDLVVGVSSFVDIVHELGHAYFYESPTKSCNLTPYQTEELMCEIYSQNFLDILKIATEIMEQVALLK